MTVWLVGEFPEMCAYDADLVRKDSLPPTAFSDCHPQTIIFRQDHPGTLPRETIERWRRRFPLARLCVAYGDWSEGEMRTGQPLPGVERVRLIELPAWLTTLADQPRLPATATVAEGIEAAEISPEVVERLTGIRTALVASVYETHEALASLAESLGLAVSTENEAVELILWSDGDFHLTQGQASLTNARAKFPSAAIVALVHFPRKQEADFAKSCGVSELVASPVLARNLAGAIVRALDHRL
jgi:hypothetical protein